MTNFNNEAYQVLVKDLIGDIFYSSSSYRSKVSVVRQYAEVVVRRILDIDPDKKVMLVNDSIQNNLKKIVNADYLCDAVERVREGGNKTIHTQYREEITSDEFEQSVDALLDILSFLLINYFEEYKFGSNREVMSSFSFLPPIIRYKVLNFLYTKDPQNIDVIDKLVLVTMKAFNIDVATQWIEERKEKLSNLAAFSQGSLEDITSKLGLSIEELQKKERLPKDLYSLCKLKIQEVGNNLKEKGTLYNDFESAYPFYLRGGVLEEKSEDAKKFNDIMKFLFMGRKENMRQLEEKKGPYLVIYNID